MKLAWCCLWCGLLLPCAGRAQNCGNGRIQKSENRWLARAAEPGRFQTIDRVALAIGNQAVTESQIEEELRITALLNHAPLVLDNHARRQAASRMVQQFLIRRETEVSRFPAPEAREVDAYRSEIAHDYGGEAALSVALQRYGLNAAVLRDHLELQLLTLRFISFRFRPQVSGSEAEISRRSDEMLALWLVDARKRSKVVYMDKSLEE